MNIYRKALDGVFTGLLKGAKNLAYAPLAGIASGSVLKELPEGFAKATGINKGLGGAIYKGTNAAAQGVSRAGIAGVSMAPKGIAELGKGAYHAAKSAIPGLKRGASKTWKAVTRESMDGPMSRELRPVVQHTIAGAGIAGGAYAGVQGYQASKERRPGNIQNEVPATSYDGRPNKMRDIENTTGLVQALNDLR
jgi:hypothetical protein